MIERSSGVMKSFDGTPIYYELRGSGQPVVLCYGLVCTTNHWINQIKFFSNRYQVITLDYRGHHKSGSPDLRENLTIDAIGEDIAALSRHLGLAPAYFWGHSFGGQILIRTYEMYPEIFRGMILMNSFATNPVHGKFDLDMMGRFFSFVKEGYDRLPETMNYLWKAAVNNPLSVKITGWTGGFNLSLTSMKDIEVYMRGVAGVDLDVFVQLYEQMVRYDGRPVLHKISIPTLIIGGTKDGVTPLPFQKVLHSGIKRSEFLVVPYGSHCVQLDMPELVNLRVQQFLSAQGYNPK